MRLKDKLIHKNCPSCEGEITLSASSLNKKINCPRCRQTIIIPDDGGAAPEKPTPQKAVARGKSNGRHASAAAPETAVKEARISIQAIHGPRPVEEIPAATPPEPETSASQKSVVYCLCNGILKKRRDSKVCCVFANEMGF